MSARFVVLLVICALAPPTLIAAPAPGDLNLIPFPKLASLESGTFAVKPVMSLVVTDTAVARQAAADLRNELKRAANATCKVSLVGTKPGLPPYWLLLSAGKTRAADIAKDLSGTTDKPEGYRLVVRPGYAAVGAKDRAGLVWGIQTLLQLVRANMRGAAVPCVTIDDWPTLAHRGFMDDITRGPSAKLETLELETRMAALTKMNMLNYYIEHQFEFSKYPDIGPKDGSLTPAELTKLVDYAAARDVDVIGNQQSFGHWATILRNEKYRHLGETWWVLNPSLEETYQMLDAMYSEQVPLTKSQYFNVDCDETGGLGTRANRELARQIGVGGIYAKHITRLHDLLRDKYHKRMLMWGDIILRHPENLGDIPKDTIMLTWDYGDRVSYNDKVAPFEKAGFEFWVCPTTTCWSVLPDFGFAMDNIQGFVRDGANHGTTGILNTTWDDDAESFFGYYWHGIAWGAECGWNGSATSTDDFNRRVGPVLFGDRDNHFGKAIALLIQTHKKHIDISTHRFWRTAGMPSDKEQANQQAQDLLAIVDPALSELRLARQDAKVNADQLDYVIFGAERMKCMATRMLALLDASDAYAKAGSADSDGAAFWLQKAAKDIETVRDEHARLKNRFEALWQREEKPYSMDWTVKKYDDLIASYDKILSGLESAKTTAKDGKPLPAAKDLGL